jgi:hypothetical protein
VEPNESNRRPGTYYSVPERSVLTVCDSECMLIVGSTRTHYCDHCERDTVQRLEHLSKNGVGDFVAGVWRCAECDRHVDHRPPPAPQALEDLWNAN